MRLHVKNNAVYLIRDLPRDQWAGADGMICEYAVASGDRSPLDAVWHPCAEGVQFDDIEPFATMVQLSALAALPSGEAVK